MGWVASQKKEKVIQGGMIEGEPFETLVFSRRWEVPDSSGKEKAGLR